MSELVCLRCDWTGTGDASRCPSCGTRLYRVNRPTPVETPRPDVEVSPATRPKVGRALALIAVALVVAATTFVFVTRDAPGERAIPSPVAPGPLPPAVSSVSEGCATKPAPPGRVSTPSAADGRAVTAALVADYRFHNSFATSVGTAPALVENPDGPGRFADESVRGQTRSVLRFDRGRGLSLPTGGVIQSGEYTIELLFRLDRLTGYRKIIDFKKASNDSGLYSLDGCLTYVPRRPASPATIGVDTYAQVVLTRDAAAQVVGYVDGIRQFSFHDPRDLAVVDGSHTLLLFRDDSETHTDYSGGAVSRIRLFDRPLVGSEVAALACVDLPAWFCS